MTRPKISPVLPELREVLQGLVGKPCWNFAASVNTGSHVSLDFGQLVKREVPLKNPRVSETVRRYSGEVELFIKSSWRLDSDLEVLCGAEDDNTEEGPMQHGLRQLQDRQVSSVLLREPGLDLILGFEGGLTLRVFCDELNADTDGNYSVFVPGYYYQVGRWSYLVKKPRKRRSKVTLKAVPTL